MRMKLVNRHAADALLVLTALTISGGGLKCLGQSTSEASTLPPNFIVFLTDDQGYGDVSSFYPRQLRTPHFDRLASEGIRLTSHYVGAPVCGPSRAALLTGSYPIRIAEPKNQKSLHTVVHGREIMISELLRDHGYSTGLVGKWHVGGHPNDGGFDYFFGTLRFNGVTKFIEQNRYRAKILRNRETIVDRVEQADMDHLTTRYTDEALRFIASNKDRPFFLLLSHNMPHVPLGVSSKFRGKSEGGLYGDVIEELDWSLGQVMAKLDALGLDERTLIVFLSDNGPWIEKQIGDHAGSPGPLRGAKMKSWEGGARVPCIMRWNGQISAGTTSDEITTAMDLFPTFAKLAGVPLPADRTIDGKDLFPLVSGQTNEGPHDHFFYYCYTHLHGVRDGRWKLVLPRPAQPAWMGWWKRMIEEVPEPQLYDMTNDLGEKTNVADVHPEVVKRLTAAIEEAREELGDCDRIGTGARFFDAGPKRPGIQEYNNWRDGQKKQ